MSAPVLSIEAGSEIVQAAERMRAAKVGALVVTEGTKVIGIITEIDLLRHTVETETARDPALDIIISYP